jgi:AraC family transcriptional regulator, regulatory protein of adaptative response / methylated-DNA-[protein]-cysteine methyltransferase
MSPEQLTTDYARIEKAIRFLDRERAAAPSLAEVAAHVGLSETHFQKLFTRWAGISPKRFLQHRTAEVVKRLLREERAMLDVTYEAGLSGPGRLHDLIVNAEAVTPGEYQRRGEGLTVRYGFHPTPFGECVIAMTPRGICHLAFVHPVSRHEALDRVKRDWPEAKLVPDQDATRAAAAQAFPAPGVARQPGLALHVRGTMFQITVWRALLEVPTGDVTTYGAIAGAIGDAKASRAVGTAIGSNPVSYLIPCHRVIRASGEMGNYAWGVDRKRVMLALETSERDLPSSVSSLPSAPTPPARRPATPRVARLASVGGAPRVRSA